MVNHLTFGVGLAYPEAATKPPDTDPGSVFANVQRPTTLPAGEAALQAFETIMGSCLERLRALPPDQACWTYAGPGTASFWFRRAAIETSLHRLDVADALSVGDHHLTSRWAGDAIAETVEFALPFAAELTGQPKGQLVVATSCLGQPLTAGSDHGATATVTGDPVDVLRSLWGRASDRIHISDDIDVAREWLSLVETAFAGR